MKVDELIERASSVRDFDTHEVADRIESLSEPEVEELTGDEAFVDRLVDDVRALQGALNSRFVDRDELIEMALACFIAHLPMIALGPPGTAKSNVFRALSYTLGLQESPVSIEELQSEVDQLLSQISRPSSGRGRAAKASATPSRPSLSANGSRAYFEYLVTRFTTPEELLGPANLELMIHHAMFYRQTKGLLPQATVAFLDEIFKANSAILNALLGIMNERIFYNAGRPVRVPLCMVFGASNEPPAEKELGALYDRFPVRVLCLPVEDNHENLAKLLQRAVGQACDSLLSGSEPRNAFRQVATVNHFRMLHRIIHVKYGGRSVAGRNESFLVAFSDAYRTLKREFDISDRSFFLLYRLARSLAILRQHHELRPSELEVFQYCFRDPEAAAPLADAVRDRIRRFTRQLGAAA